ncbi:hypothetical protein P3X46_021734 [Hevea brasiliensis]|uniref:Gnk2-homologous domain-containing protein n=1 Tax=Hevea brasiliensis TaxID=3981 RepID=A0ABQ9LIH2_HEVBR|nr:hypothetical protein P3X46_021734 [Hevea brasiliensis]
MLRCRNGSIFGPMEGQRYFWVHRMKNVSDVNRFNLSRMTLLDRLRSATNASQKIQQCTSDLSKQECSDCLTQATGSLPQCCNEKQGGRVITPSCNFQCQIDLFYNPAAVEKLRFCQHHKHHYFHPHHQPVKQDRVCASNIPLTLIIGFLSHVFVVLSL